MQTKRVRAEEHALLVILAGAAVLVFGAVAYLTTRTDGTGNNSLIWLAVMVLGVAILIFGYSQKRKRTQP